MGIKRKFDYSSDETKRKCVDEIITRLEESEEPGIIAAEDLIQIVMSNLGADIYNKAVDDIKMTIETKVQDMQIDIDLLKQS